MKKVANRTLISGQIQWGDILQDLQLGNGPTLRFFKATPSNEILAQFVTAFANSKGGKLVVGIDIQNYHMVGTHLEESELRSFLQAHIRPKLNVEISQVKRNDRSLVVIQVEESSRKPVFLDQQSYIVDMSSPFQPVEYTPPEPFHVLYGTSECEESPKPDKPLVMTAGMPTHYNVRQSKTLVHLGDHFSISNKTYRQLFGVSHKTAHLELVDLVEKGVLEPQGSGRSTCYIMKKESLN